MPNLEGTQTNGGWWRAVLTATLFFLFPPLSDAQPVRGVAGDLWADQILGQADIGNLSGGGILNSAFGQITPNQVVNQYVINVGGALVDGPHNRAFVYDSGNNRILVYNNLTNALASVNSGGSLTQGPDAVLGQLDFNHSSCNWDASFW